MEKTVEYFQEVIAESKVYFQVVDFDGDGTVRFIYFDFDCRGCYKKGGVWRVEGVLC